MKEYKCIRIGVEMEDYIFISGRITPMSFYETEDLLNELAKEGWKLICSYAAFGGYLIMERDVVITKVIGDDLK